MAHCVYVHLTIFPPRYPPINDELSISASMDAAYDGGIGER
jgi:hypothetical protein